MIGGKKRKTKKTFHFEHIPGSHIFDKMDHLVIIADREGTILYLNKTICNYTKEGTIGRKVYQYVSKNQHEVVENAFKQVFEKKKAGKYLLQFSDGNGNPIWFETHYSPILKGKKVGSVLLVSEDITEKKHIQEELEISKEKYSDLVEGVRVGVYAINTKGRYTFVNKAMEDILGASKEEIIGDSIFTYVDISSYKSVLSIFNTAIKSHKAPEIFTVNIKRKDGGKRIVEVNLSLYFRGGKLIEGRGTVRDITQMLKAQEALKLFMKGYQTSPNSQLLISYKEKQPTITWVNDAFTEYYGYSLNEVIGANPSIISSGETSKETYKEIWNSILDPNIGFWRGEIINKRKNGEKIHVILSISTFFDDQKKPFYFAASHLDITQEKRLEENLRVAQSIVDYSKVPIYILEKDGSFSFANQSAANSLGYTKKQLLQRTVFDMDKNMTKTAWKEHWGKISTIGEDSFETIHVRKDGTSFPVELVIYSITTSDGVLHRVAFAHDITLRKLQEQQAAEVDRMKTEFVSLASHQLRTPLTAIRWGIELLQDELLTVINDKQRGMLDDVHASSQRMIKLVSSLLNVSRIESGRLKVEPESIKIQDLVEGVVKELQPIAHAKNVDIKFILEEKRIPALQLDPALTRQVIFNLVSNAVKYSHPGNKPVEVRVSKNKSKQFEISIKDHGIGIKKDEQKRIFEKFFRAQNAIAQETDGNGLGLYIAKMIVDQVGGEIKFTSAFGKGSEFILVLPKGGMKPKEGEKGLESAKV